MQLLSMRCVQASARTKDAGVPLSPSAARAPTTDSAGAVWARVRRREASTVPGPPSAGTATQSARTPAPGR